MAEQDAAVEALQAELARLRQYINDLEHVVVKLQQRETIYHLLYTAMTEGVAIHEIVTDAAGNPIDYRILDVNPAFETITGISRVAAVGQLASALYLTDEPPFLTTYAQVAASGEPTTFEATVAISAEPQGRTFRIVAISPAPGQFAIVFRDITEQQRAAARLRQSEARYREITELISDAVYSARFEPDGSIVSEWGAETLVKITGYPIARNFPDIWYKLIHPDENDVMQRRLERFYANQPSIDEYRIITQRGEVRWLHDHGRPVFDPTTGRLLRVYGAITDITEQKQAEERLQQQQLLFQSFLDHSPMMVYARDREGRFLMVNHAYELLLGLPADQIIGYTADEVLSAETAALAFEQDYAVLASGAPIVREFNDRTSGAERTYLTTKFPITNDQGIISAVGGISTDITDYRYATRALHEQQRVMQAFLDYSPTIIAAKDAQGRYAWTNKRYSSMVLHRTQEEIIGKTPYDIFPDELADIMVEQDNLVLQTGQAQQNEDIIPHEDGPHIYLTIKFPLYDTDGNLSGIGAIGTDMTERQRAQQELDMFKALVEYAMDGIVLMNTDGTIHYANAAAARIMRVSREELVGFNGFQIDSYNQQRLLQEEILPALRSRRYWQGDAWAQRPDGSFWWSQSSIVMVGSRDSDYYYAASIFRDATEQRQMEEQLQLTRFALDNALDGVAFLDQESRYLYVNHAACRARGYTHDELLAMRLIDVEPDLTLAWWRQIWEHLQQQGSTRFETIHHRKDGSSYPVEIASNYLEFRGKAYICSLVRDISERTAYQEQIERLAFTDPLTGLANRRRLYEVGEAALTTGLPGSVALLYLDLDRFKAFNDTLGHDAGDQLLLQVTQRLQIGIGAAGLLARIGGDEFAVLLAHTDTEVVTALAHTLLELLHQPFDITDYRVHLSGSIGIAFGPVAGQSFSALLTRADIAMYRAKRTSSGMQIYDPLTNELSTEQVQFESELRQALEGDGLALHYQPIFDLATRRLFAVEALVRWPHPTRGLLMPGAFLPLAEEAGLLRVLDDWVLRAALAQMAAWQAAGEPRSITINLSAPSVQQVALVDRVAHLLAEAGVPAERLIVEITEHVALRDLSLTYQVLTGLQALGVQIALDDFGTGYAALTHLRELPIDILKIERAFASGIGDNAKDEAVLRAVMALGEGLEMIVVAEGVETEDQLRWLREVGYRHVQGYLLGRPAPPEQIHTIVPLQTLLH
jgi:diguanylate cyclase (GGDEF)-like protein/PAS domain S-box-containing protein